MHSFSKYKKLLGCLLIKLGLFDRQEDGLDVAAVGAGHDLEVAGLADVLQFVVVILQVAVRVKVTSADCPAGMCTFLKARSSFTGRVEVE